MTKPNTCNQNDSGLRDRTKPDMSATARNNWRAAANAKPLKVTRNGLLKDD